MNMSFTPKKKRIYLPGYEMNCASSEAQSYTYKLYTGKSGRIWLIPQIENKADMVHVSDSNPYSQGYGGATLEFDLGGGNKILLQGPWHGNADAFFDDTGVDIRDCHLTRVIIAAKRGVDKEGGGSYYEDIFYEEDEPKLGEWDRCESLAQHIADTLNKTVFVYQKSHNGSSSCPIHPQKKKENQDENIS